MGLAPGPRGRQGALWSRPRALPAGGAAAAQGGAAPAPPISPVAGGEAAPETRALVNPASEGEPWRRRGRHLRTRPALRLCSRGHLAAALGARRPRSRESAGGAAERGGPWPAGPVPQWGQGGRGRAGAGALRPEGAGSRAEPGRARGGHACMTSPRAGARRGLGVRGQQRLSSLGRIGAQGLARGVEGRLASVPAARSALPCGSRGQGLRRAQRCPGRAGSCARWLSTPRGTAGTLDRARGPWGRRYKGSRGHEVSERPGSGEQTQGSEWSGRDAGAGSSARGAGAGLSPRRSRAPGPPQPRPPWESVGLPPTRL